MFEVKRSAKKSIIVIRSASPKELSNYEKWKLKNVEEGAQVNKLEMIKVETPSKKEAFVSVENKTAKIELGELALKSKITPEEISPEDLFLIECALEG